MAIRLPPEIQPMRQLPVKNYVPGVYAGFSHTNPAEEQGLRNEMGDQWAAEVLNTRKRRDEAAEIRSVNNLNVAIESARFNQPANAVNVGIRGRKGFHTGKGRANIETRFQFYDALPIGANMGTMQKKDKLRMLSDAGVNWGRNKVDAFLQATTSPSLPGASRNIRQMMNQLRTRSAATRSLGGRKLFGRTRRSRQGLGRRRSRR